MDWSTPRCKGKNSFGDTSRKFDWEESQIGREKQNSLDQCTLAILSDNATHVHVKIQASAGKLCQYNETHLSIGITPQTPSICLSWHNASGCTNLPYFFLHHRMSQSPTPYPPPHGRKHTLAMKLLTKKMFAGPASMVKGEVLFRLALRKQ